MEDRLCTSHASIDATRARTFLEGAKDDRQGLRKVYAECFFDGSIAAAEAAVQFALKTTDSALKAVELAHILKALPTAIPVRTAQPLARLCAFLAISFSQDECRAPLNTFCYADNIVRRAALRAVFERLRDLVRTKPGALGELLNRVREFLYDIANGPEEIDGHIVIERLVGLASGMSTHVRTEIFSFLFSLDTHLSSSLFQKGCDYVFEDYDSYLVSQLANLVSDSDSMGLLLLRCLVHSLEFCTMASLRTLWTSHRAQVILAVSVVGRDCFLFLLVAQAARLACYGNISGCNLAVQIARHILDSKDGALAQLHDVVSSMLVTLCASIGATSSACREGDLNRSLAEILHSLRVSKTTETSREAVLHSIRYACQQSHRWRCSGTTAVLCLLLRIIELWASPPQLKTWLENDLTVIIRSTAVSHQGDEQGSSMAEASGKEAKEDPDRPDFESDETFGALLVLLGVSVLCHPTSYVRLGAVESLRNTMNSRASLFCLPSILMRLQHETNGVVAVKIIRDLLTSRSLLQQSDTSKISLNTCIQTLGNSTTKEARNSTTYQAAVATLGYATVSAPGLATALLLREVEKLKDSFGLTAGPVRASASAAILKLVESRPTRGTNFIPFISLCIAPESMAVIPEAASLCFEVMNIMAQEEVLDPIKAVKIVMKNYPDIVDVEPKARRSYLKLLGSVSQRSSTKKGAVIANKVVALLRRCLTGLHPEMLRQREPSRPYISWEDIGQAAQSLGQFTVEEILRLVYAADEPMLDVQSEAERTLRIEKECQDFAQEILSVSATAYHVQRRAADCLRLLLVKIVFHEWENRQRSSFDPGRIAKLRAASEALRRARQTRGTTEGDSVKGIDGFARAVKGLPHGVIKGMFEECIWSADGDERARSAKTFWMALRVILTAKALSPALPWVPLVAEVMTSPKSNDEERASCLAVFRALEDDSFELKEARARWFDVQSSLFDSTVPTSVAEGKELFVGMVHFYPAEATRLLFKHKETTSPDTTLDFIRASQELRGIGINNAAQSLFPLVLSACVAGDKAACELIERDFYETILTKCDEPLVEKLLMDNITEPSAIRIACMARSYNLLRQAALVAVAEEGDQDLLATIGRTITGFDAAHRREFVIDVCSSNANGEIRERQLRLAAHVFGVAALLPYSDMALSVATCFCARADRVAVARTIASIMRC